MSLLLWVGLWGLIWLSGSNRVSPFLPNCSDAKEDSLLPPANRTVCRRSPHLRSGDSSMTELNATLLPTGYLNISDNIHSQCEPIMGFLSCFLRDHTLARFMIFILMFWLLGTRIIFFSLLFCIKRNFFTDYIWNLAVSDFGALLALFSIFIFFCTCAHTNDTFVKLFLLLAYLFLFMQCTSIHFLTAIITDWCLIVRLPIWHRCHRPKYLSFLISAILSVFLWALSCWLLFFFHLGVNTQTIIIIPLMVFTPLMAICTQTLVIKFWFNECEQGKLRVDVLPVMFFSFVIWTLLSLFIASHHNFTVISSLAFVFTSLCGIISPVLHIFFGQILLSDSGSLRLHSKWF